jgi:hypothetical protein
MGEKKGFSGLDDLSTDIDDIIKEHDREDKKNIEQKKECVDNTSASQDNNTEDSITTSISNTSKVANDDSKKSSLGLFRWLIAIGVLIFIIIISNNNSSSSDKSSASNTKNYSSNTQTSAYSKPSTDDYYESKPDSYLTTLNKNQLLYCEAEKIRLDFVQNKIDLYSTLEVDKYNNLSNDYNSRCANKQYYKNDMNYVDRNIEKKRYQLQQDGLARFSKSNSESLNSQSYNTNQPKKQTNQKGASSNEKNLCIQKGGKNSWNFELDKPICNINGTEFFYDNLDKSSSTSSLKTTYFLTINTIPTNAKIMILNIEPKYKDKIKLEKGSYHIKVSKDGYETIDQWISLDKDIIYTAELNKIAKYNTYSSLPNSSYNNTNISIKSTSNGIPANAQIDFTGHDWTCNSGYYKSGRECVKVNMPANAQIDFTGHDWTCNSGYYKSGRECVKVNMPANAQIDFTGHDWTCNYGFQKIGKECKLVGGN